MKRWLSRLNNNNAQGEYYITDIIAMAYREGREIAAVHPARISETDGVNNRLQLSRTGVFISPSRQKSCCSRALCCAIRRVSICVAR